MLQIRLIAIALLLFLGTLSCSVDSRLVAEQPSDNEVTFTFQGTPWTEVLKQFADWSQLTLDLTDVPPGEFNYYDNRSHTPSEAIDILNGYLLPRGYVLIRRDRFLVCLKTDHSMLDSLIPTISVDELSERGANELVKVIVPTDDLAAEVAAEEVRGLLGPFGAATPLESSNSLLLKGFGRGLRQAISVVQQSRPAVTDDKLDFKAYPIEHLPVADAERQIRNLFGVASPTKTVNVSGARADVNRERYGRGRDDRSRDDRSRDQPPPIPLLEKVAMNMQISSLERTNSLLVTATPEGLKLVEEILLSIDVPSGDSAEQFSGTEQASLRVYGMTTADEGEVAKTIDVLMPGVIVNEDRRQDTIHVYATPDEHGEVERLIRTLDISEGGSRTVSVIQLTRSDPAATAEFLRDMFSNNDREDRPSVQAELGTRSLVVRATDNQLDEVRQALIQLGEPARSVSQPTASSRIRRVRVGDENRDEVLSAAKRIFEGTQTNPGFRVVVPGRSSESASLDNDEETSSSAIKAAIDERRTLSSTPTRVQSPVQPPVQSPVRSSGQRLIGDDNAPKSQASDAAMVSTMDVDRSRLVSTKTEDRRPMVKIEVVGDDLMIQSGDPDALASVEATLRDLVRQMPDRTTWTVFYLRVAGAEAAAVKLSQLVSANSTSPAVSAGLSLREQTEPPLQIIPDVRTNAIFVSGPRKDVDQVEMFLEYIDATQVPGSFLNREPHAIPVKYADIDGVADLIRNLYKDYLVDPVAERLRNQRSSRRSSSRGDDDDDDDGRSSSQSSSGGGGDAKDSPGIRLTLAVDKQTNELLVACNDQLFEEIESVVLQRDIAAEENQTIVEVIAIPEVVRGDFIEVLQSISPRVSVDTVTETESRRRRRSE